MTDDLIARLHALVTQWQDAAVWEHDDMGNAQSASTFDQCAIELSAALEAAASLPTCAREFKELDRYAQGEYQQKGWDSYDGAPIDQRAIDAARTFLRYAWAVVPCSDGGIQLEQHCYGFDIEIEFNANGTIEKAWAEAAASLPPQVVQRSADMTFGEAITAMKAGKSVQRAGWNGKNMHIYIEDGYTAFKGQPTERHYEPVICMFNAQGKHQPGWLANQPDILSDDWQVVP